MAFDGIVVADLVHEFRRELINGAYLKNRPAGER